MDTPKYDLYSPAFKARPYPTFAHMRDQDPVLQQPGIDGRTPIWFVTRFEDVQAVLLDDRRFVRDYRNALTEEELGRLPSQPPVMARIENHMLNKDGEDHKRLRALVNKAFTPQIVARLRPRVQELAETLLDQVADRGQMDLMEAYAFPLPITVIAELLGIPTADQASFRSWSDAIVTPVLDPGEEARFFQQMEDFTGYLKRLFARRRKSPQQDLISALLQAEEAGDRLSEEELFSMVVLLIIAGHETTVSLIGNAVLALLENPDQLARLKAEAELLPTAVEELLRFEGPVERALNRWVAEDLELGGKTMRRGDIVIVILDAANRDSAHFRQADRLDLARTPNRHLAFGRGVHYCLGASLARMEGEIALETLFRYFPDLKLAAEPKDLSWEPIPMFRRLRALPVTWTAGASGG